MQALTKPSSNRRRFTRLAGTGATALLAATAVASTAAAATTPARPIGVSGSVASLSGSSMEVQNASTGQTTVNWSTTTTFSKTVTETVSALAAGNCVTVSGTPSKNSKTTIAARSITVSTASSSGSCTPGDRTGTAAGAAGAGGGFPGGGFRRAGGTGASGSAQGGTRPSFGGGSNFRKGLANLAIASGKVTAVSGSTVTVSGISISPGLFARGATNSSSKTKKPTAPKTKTETLMITTSSTTTVSATQTAASTDLAVGDCVSAFGPAATNGSVTAGTVRITATSGTCSGGFGGFGGGGPGGFGGPGGPGGGGPGA